MRSEEKNGANTKFTLFYIFIMNFLVLLWSFRLMLGARDTKIFT